MNLLTRRAVLAGLSAPFQAQGQALNLLDIAAAHVRIAESNRGKKQLWGRIGGSPAEHQSARTFGNQLKPYVTSVKLERFAFQAHRPNRWKVSIGDGRSLESAFPTPFNARFPEGPVNGRLAKVTPDSGWNDVRGKWAFLSQAGSTGFNSVRDKLLYERAVEQGAAGLLFSISTPPGEWRSIVRIGKFWSIEDDRYPNRRRPIPCYAIDTADGETVAAASALDQSLSTSIVYEGAEQLESYNSIGFLKGQSKSAILVVNHLDGFFQGAHDNASGIATTVGIAARLARTPIDKRPADFYFVGLAAHHDAAAGMRAFVNADPRRLAQCEQVFLIEHTDAVDTAEGVRGRWPQPLNNDRVAYLGPQGWPEIRDALPRLVRETGMMAVDPKFENACVADLVVICGQMKMFCLMTTPPFYHTDRDTLDKISARGLHNAVNLHLALIGISGGVEKGAFLDGA